MAANQCPPLEALERLAAGDDVAEDVASHAAACPGCAEQLARIRADNDLLGELAGAVAAEPPPDASTDAGEPAHTLGGRGALEIPGYDLLDELHRGGQGVVHRARQIAAKREVAVKTLLHGGLASRKQLARFEREVELVASLRHPGVVTLYESGAASTGEPYLAMELIDGRPLSEYVAGLGERDGLKGRAYAAPVVELFIKICDAADYAHRRGVIHRDLKPGNILVDAHGAPHLLDFGIAKAVGAEPDGDVGATLAGEFVGTFRYAAPEQVSGDPNAVDTRTDIYALGVLLYEQLTRTRAYELSGSIRDIVTTITDDAPPRPSSVNPALDREIDAIVTKALSKEPERRYQSAAALRDDLEAYLDDRPVAAQGDTTMYVLGKLVRRHRVGLTVAAVVAFILAALPVGFVYHIWRTHQKERRVQVALLQPLRFADWRTSRNPISSLDEYFTHIAETVRSEFANEPRLLAPAEQFLGVAAFGRRDYEQARAHLERALELERRLTPSGRSPTIAAIHHDLGRAAWNIADETKGDPDAARREYLRAESEYTTALEMRRELLGPDAGPTGRTLYNLAYTYCRLERDDLAAETYRQSLNTLMNAGKEWTDALASAHFAFGVGLKEMGERRAAGRDEPAARDYFQRSMLHHGLAYRILDDGPDSFFKGAAAQGYGASLLRLGQTGRARDLLEDAVTITERTLGADARNTLQYTQDLAQLVAEDDLAEAVRIQRDVVRRWRREYADADPGTRAAVRLLTGWLDQLADAALADGRRPDAAALLDEAAQLRTATLGPDHERTRATIARIEAIRPADDAPPPPRTP